MSTFSEVRHLDLILVDRNYSIEYKLPFQGQFIPASFRLKDLERELELKKGPGDLSDNLKIAV